MRARLARCGGALALTCAGAAGLPAASLGDDPGVRAGELRRAAAELAAKERSAAVELYAIESNAADAAAELATLRRRAAAVEDELATVTARRAAARATLARAQKLLELRLRTLYETGDTDPLAVVLGAGSLEEALDGLEGLRFAAEQDREIVGRSAAARAHLARFAQSLQARRATLVRLRDAAAARVDALRQAAAERRAYITQVARERGLRERRLAGAQEEARAAVERTARLATPTPAVAAPVAVASGPATMTVRALGYSLSGSTATGLPVGWGVVAVDPSVIPLGTRLTIPGYGEGVAADTGSGVHGATIDLWFPTRDRALAWGSRMVTITLRP